MAKGHIEMYALQCDEIFKPSFYTKASIHTINTYLLTVMDTFKLRFMSKKVIKMTQVIFILLTKAKFCTLISTYLSQANN
jgi:hypothetical protein